MPLRDVERYTLPSNPIAPLDLAALRVLKKATEIGGPEIEPSVDAAYVLKALEEMTDKLNEVIKRSNEANFDEKIHLVASKLNQVVGRLNTHFFELSQTLQEETDELKAELPSIDTETL